MALVIDGVYLGTCVDGVQFGSCCKLPPEFETNLENNLSNQNSENTYPNKKFPRPPEIKLSNQIKVIGTLQSELNDDISVLFSLDRSLY